MGYSGQQVTAPDPHTLTLTSHLPPRTYTFGIVTSRRSDTVRRTATPHFISLQDAATRTGFSVFTFREKIANGELPAYRLSNKPGAAIRVKIADVDSLMKPVIPTEVYADHRQAAQAGAEAET
jgi:excisionase family DNA binding protein